MDKADKSPGVLLLLFIGKVYKGIRGFILLTPQEMCLIAATWNKQIQVTISI